MRFAKSYGLECGHHTPKEFRDIQFDFTEDLGNAHPEFYKSLVSDYMNYIRDIPGIDTQYCAKCDDMKKVSRISIFVESTHDDGSGIKT